MSDPSESVDEYDRTKQEPAHAEPPTEKQRLRISVPRLRTTISMGEGAKKGQLYREDPTEVLHFAGFGVTTEGNLHLETRGPRETSRVKLQTNGEITLHSVDDSLNIGAKRGVVVGTDKTNLLWGAGGTYLVGGSFGPLGGLASSVAAGGLQTPDRDHHPATPEWVKGAEHVKLAMQVLMFVNSLHKSGRIKAAKKLKKDQGLRDVDIENAGKPNKRVKAFVRALRALKFAYPYKDKLLHDPGDEKSDTEKFVDGLANDLGALVAGTTILGQGKVTVASPGIVSVKGIGGVEVDGRLAVSVSSHELVSIESGKAVSLLSGGNMEAFAAKNLTIAASEVAHIGSNKRLTLTAQEDAVLRSKGDAHVYGERSLNLMTNGESHFATGRHSFSAKEIADFDGTEGAYFRSAKGMVAVISHEKDVSIGAKQAVNVHSNDAIVRVEPKKISLTVDGDKAELKAGLAEYYDFRLNDVMKEWSAAREKDDHDDLEKLHQDLKKLMKQRKEEMDAIDGKVAGFSPNPDNGIEITKSAVTLSVGSSSQIKLKAGKVEVLKALEVKG